MKCSNCGNNLELEQQYCPYCGAQNEAAQKHNADMKQYRRQFEQVQEDVLENSRNFRSYVAKWTVIIVLALLTAVCVILLQSRYEIKGHLDDRRISKNLEEYRETLSRYEENREYILMYEYMYQNSLSRSDSLREYHSAVDCASEYTRIYNYIFKLLDGEDSYMKPEVCIQNISASLYRIQGYSTDDSYKSRYNMLAEPHMSFINDIKAELQVMMQAYFNLTEEQAESIWTISEARINVMLEEGWYGEQ